jgi:hypothetical protein
MPINNNIGYRLARPIHRYPILYYPFYPCPFPYGTKVFASSDVSHFEGNLIAPDAARVILGARDDSISLVVERAGEDLIRMAFQLLQELSALAVPQSGDLIESCCQDLCALWIEDYL